MCIVFLSFNTFYKINYFEKLDLFITNYLAQQKKKFKFFGK